MNIEIQDRAGRNPKRRYYWCCGICGAIGNSDTETNAASALKTHILGGHNA